MPSSAETIYIVDDDPAVRDALSVVFDLEGFDVKTFSDGETFLTAASQVVPSCVILDVHMPGRSGLEILKSLAPQTYEAPVFIISGQGDIPMAVEAIKLGAFDFIEKPFSADTVVSRVRESIATAAKRADRAEATDMQAFAETANLTQREREVLKEITDGASNKEAGRALGISPRTVEVHRALPCVGWA